MADTTQSTCVIWGEGEVEHYVSLSRPGASSPSRDFVEPGGGSSFRVSGGTQPGETQDPAFFSPRHHHHFDQVRYYFEGSVDYGERGSHGAGDCLYIPGGTWYGPLTRPVRGTLKNFNLQFSGVSPSPYYSPREMSDAKQALAQHGEFRGGHYFDEKGSEKDAFEAIFGEFSGKALVYPDPPLDQYVLIHSDRLSWHDVDGLSGVRVKDLLQLGAEGPRLRLLKLAPGALLPGAVSGTWQELQCLGQGSVTFGEDTGREFGSVTNRYIPPGTRYGEVVCLEEALLFSVQWVPFKVRTEVPAAD